MTNDVWNGTGNWTANPSDWSLDAPPGPSQTAEVATGTNVLTSTTTVAGLTIDPAAVLYLERGAALTVSGNLANNGDLDMASNSSDGASALTLSGALSGAGAVTIGNADLTGPVTVTAGSYGDAGALSLLGGAAPNSNNLATLDIQSAAPTILAATTTVAGDALLEFASGNIEAVAQGADLTIGGSQARISIGSSAASTALQNFMANAGAVSLEGNWGGYAGGAALSSLKGLTNIGTFTVDDASSTGGSLVDLGGALYNLGSVTLGDNSLRVPTTVSATSLVNDASLVMEGAGTEGAEDATSLDLSGAAPLATTGNLSLLGAADLVFASGNLEVISPGTTLVLQGAEAQIQVSGVGSNSALGDLDDNGGTLNFEGNYQGDNGGVTLFTQMGLTNAGTFYVDAGSGAGGSEVSFDGTLGNYGVTVIGNNNLALATTVTGTALANTKTLVIEGSDYYESVDQATLDVTTTDYTSATGNVELIGDALLELPSNVSESVSKPGVKPLTSGDPGITSIAYGGSLLLNGSQARVALGAGSTNTGLDELSLNDGAFNLEGNYENGPGGASVTDDVGLTNAGSLYVDVGDGAGGSGLTVLGALTNAGLGANPALLEIGNPSLSAPTLVLADSLSTSGDIVLLGEAPLDAENEATLEIESAAPSAVAGSWVVEGDALMEFASGSVTTVDPESALEIDGGQAQISDSGGAFDSAIGNLSASYGNLTIGGNAGNGAGAATIALAKGLVTTFDFYVDAAGAEGGTALTVTGALLNSGATYVGNTSLTADTSVAVGSFTNNGEIYLAGNASGGGEQAVLDITGAAGLGTTGAITGYVQLNGNALLEFGSGGITSIAPDSTLAILTGQSPGGGHVAVAGNLTSNSALTGLKANYGEFALSFGAVVATTAGTNFINDGSVDVDTAASSDGGSALEIGGTLYNSGDLDVGAGFGPQTIASTVTAASLDNYGDLTLAGDASAGAAVNVSGEITNEGASNVGAFTTLDSGSNPYLQYAGTTTVAGAIDASAIDDEGGLTDFTTALAGSGTLNLYGGAAMEFGAAASRTVTFKSTTGTLELGAPGSFTGTIAGFAGNDSIDLLNAQATGLSYSGGTLTVTGSSGTIAQLALSGSFTSTSFTAVSDGRGGTDILLTPAVEWTAGNGSWATSVNWTSAPTTSSDAVLPLGNAAYAVTATSAISVGSITITDPNAQLQINTPSSTDSVGSNIVNGGVLDVDSSGGQGGSTLTLGGALDNENQTNIGNSDLGAATTVNAKGLENGGTISLYGNNSLTPTDLATLDIASAAPSVLTGNLYVHGDSLVEFASGNITTIAQGSELQLDGANSRVSIGAGTTNSALQELSRVTGTFDEEGDWDTGPGGSSVTTTTSLTVTGSLDLDVYGGDGDSRLTVGGTLTDTGNITVGNDALSGNTTLTATSLVDDGTLSIWGNEAASPTDLSTLDITGAGPGLLSGSLYVHGDALVEFASGGITSIAHDAELQLDGAYARISDGSGMTNSALGNLATIAGTFDEEGDWSTGPGGALVTTSVGMTVTGALNLDIYSGDGASTLNIGGTLANRGVVTVGNPAQQGDTTLTATALANDGDLTLWGSGSASPTYQTTVDIAGAPPGTVTGNIELHGNADLEFGSGNITSVAAGSELQINGEFARISNGASSSSTALQGLSSNAGTLDFEGGENGGAGGATLTTLVGMTNTGDLDLDVGYSDGSSTLTIGGALTNRGQLDVGNADLGGNSTLAAASLANQGTIELQGQTSASPTGQATLSIGAAAAGAINGDIIVRGGAALEYASGSFTSITAGSILELDGAHAVVTDGSGALNSALGNLSTIAGELLLRGRSNYGAGGESLSVGALTVTGELNVDTQDGDGGSQVTLSGALVNDGTVAVGNTSSTASTVLSGASMTNRGVFDTYGSTGNVSNVDLAGALNNYDTVNVGANSLFDLTGDYEQYAGSTTIAGSLESAAVIDQGGLIDFTGGLAGTTTGKLEIFGAGQLEFGGAVATGNTVAFEAATGELTLGDPGAFAATITGFSANDVIDLAETTATSVSYASGVLTVDDGATVVASLKISGSYTTASFLLVSDDHGGTDILDPRASSAPSQVAAAHLVQAMATFGAPSETPAPAMTHESGGMLEAMRLFSVSAHV